MTPVWTLIMIMAAWRSQFSERVIAIDFEIPSFRDYDNVSVVQQSWYAPPSPNAFKSGGALWLTAATNSSSNNASEADERNLGRAVYRDSLRTGDAKLFPSFATSFTFQIITTRHFPDCGSGMAFFMSDIREAPLNSTSMGALGLVNPYSTSQPRSLFAVEFDTRKSSDNDDVSDSHIGVNINSMQSLTYTDTSPSSSSAYYPELFLYNNSTFTAWVQYNASTHLIEVWVANIHINNRYCALLLIFPPSRSI